MENLSYFDTLSNLIPGLAFIWGLFVLGPLSTGLFSIILTNNMVIDSILLISIAYIIGHLTQFIGKLSIEKIIQTFFWKGKRYSEVFMIKSFGFLNNLEFTRFIEIAKKLEFSDNDLSVLSKDNIQSDATKLKTAEETSHLIYRMLDARTIDENKGQKAHIHNIFYSFFRNLATIFLIFFILDIGSYFFKHTNITSVSAGIILLNFFIMLVFIYQTKNRGELYVKGLFWCYD